MNNESEETVEVEGAGESAQNGLESSRGDFLKWSSVALGGLYVGPKVTSFAVNKAMGQSGSPGPQPPPPQVPPGLPSTGGAANMSHPGSGSQMPAWLPAAGLGAAAAGVYATKKAKTARAAEQIVDAEDPR